MRKVISIIIFCMALQDGFASSFDFNGIGNGATSSSKESFFLKVVLSDSLKKTGFSIDKEAVIGSVSDTDSVYNLARVYINFVKDFHGVVTLSAYDVTGFKMGDCKMPIDANAGDALYFDFHFDLRVDIQQDTKLVLW